MKAKIVLALFCLLGTQLICAQDNKQTATQFTVKNPNTTFLGAILEAGSLNKDTHQFVDVPLNSVMVNFSLSQVKSREMIPAYENMLSEIRAALKENGQWKQNESFSYSISQLQSYGELGVFFGQEINSEKFFGVNASAKTKKTLAIINVEQAYFSMTMDLPEQLCSNPDLLSKYGKNDLIYVNSVQFGRKAVLIIESKYDYQEVKMAAENLLKNTAGALHEKYKSIIASSTIRFMVIGDEKVAEMDLDNPLTTLLNYMNQKVTCENFGLPISFTASYLSNNAMFANTYLVK